jgi:S-adenosylmethionine decarboxylase
MSVGTEWLVDAEGCWPDRLRDLEKIKEVCDRIIADLQLRVVGEAMWHQFASPGGVTGLVLLTESHLACHTYPEFGIATFNLYCCRSRPDWPWAERLKDTLGARSVRVSTVVRGVDSAFVQTRR